jgi:hypothetical protein
MRLIYSQLEKVAHVVASSLNRMRGQELFLSQANAIVFENHNKNSQVLKVFHRQFYVDEVLDAFSVALGLKNHRELKEIHTVVPIKELPIDALSELNTYLQSDYYTFLWNGFAKAFLSSLLARNWEEDTNIYTNFKTPSLKGYAGFLGAGLNSVVSAQFILNQEGDFDVILNQNIQENVDLFFIAQSIYLQVVQMEVEQNYPVCLSNLKLKNFLNKPVLIHPQKELMLKQISKLLLECFDIEFDLNVNAENFTESELTVRFSKGRNAKIKKAIFQKAVYEVYKSSMLILADKYSGDATLYCHPDMGDDYLERWFGLENSVVELCNDELGFEAWKNEFNGERICGTKIFWMNIGLLMYSDLDDRLKKEGYLLNEMDTILFIENNIIKKLIKI